jgi:hypothetical protein
MLGHLAEKASCAMLAAGIGRLLKTYWLFMFVPLRRAGNWATTMLNDTLLGAPVF